MKKLKHLGAGYHGFDPVEGHFVFVKNGEIVEVSDDKSAQLQTDFPKEWEAIEPVAEQTISKNRGKK